MYLPDEIIAIIKEYSMPITNPYWRTLHIMPLKEFLDELEYSCSYIIIYRPLCYNNYTKSFLLAKTLFYESMSCIS